MAWGTPTPFSWEGGTLSENSYKPFKDQWEVTLLRKTRSVQRLPRSFVTNKQTYRHTNILLLYYKDLPNKISTVTAENGLLKKPLYKLNQNFKNKHWDILKFNIFKVFQCFPAVSLSVFVFLVQVRFYWVLGRPTRIVRVPSGLSINHFTMKNNKERLDIECKLK